MGGMLSSSQMYEHVKVYESGGKHRRQSSRTLSEAITLVFLGDYFMGATSWWRPTNNGVYAVVDRKN